MCLLNQIIDVNKGSKTDKYTMFHFFGHSAFLYYVLVDLERNVMLGPQENAIFEQLQNYVIFIAPNTMSKPISLIKGPFSIQKKAKLWVG